ncbi:alpha-ketoacid dehydrogenase subunit beta [Truepera radiovictrix]|uniref:Transketolase central region n=1 Tax=Truepera radiovictrix (strain DSM 17093 / CIP 108686 / LMG 22925 / RQ-24) TaxID=649638 RepID=D7CTM5_TRURR|nr:alpha-ketoacid dehydrogenase subunit beta [Truepera radiovictrix]ADI13882.1 Transketolase central region [Truepera radiovictrix DSM 17093]WMT57554.1 alpha-ketoacid dehydrogenase subunit beta [Truepera radiovictrix]
MAQLNLVQSVARTLASEMARDERVVVLGEDVGKRGGVFLATEGLFDRFGPDRVIDSPLSEAAILGAAVGMAVHGLRPVAEIQFADYVYPGFDQLVSQAAKLRYRSGGQFYAPMVVRMPAGGGVKGGHHHSQNPETHFVHTPGLKVVYPSSPKDAKGLLTTAIRDDDPVVFMEPKRLYRAFKEEVPDDEYLVPLGKARVRREGDDLVLVSYGGSVAETLKAADALAEQGISAQVLDLRSLLPWDKEAVLEVVARVGRVVLVSEAPKTAGFISEVAATISEEVLDALLAPPVRVAGFDTPYPYAQDRAYLPGVNRILRAVQAVLDY